MSDLLLVGFYVCIFAAIILSCVWIWNIHADKRVTSRKKDKP